MTDLALNVAVSNTAKEYAIKKPQLPEQQQEARLLSQGLRESGLEWIETEGSELNLIDRLSETDFLLATSATDTSAKASRPGSLSQELLQELKNKFKKMFIQAYGNTFSHNRLIAKVSEWMVGNVMERLALMGIPFAELENVKAEVRAELVAQNRVAIEQVIYDETMLEIVG